MADQCLGTPPFFGIVVVFGAIIAGCILSRQHTGHALMFLSPPS